MFSLSTRTRQRLLAAAAAGAVGAGAVCAYYRWCWEKEPKEAAVRKDSGEGEGSALSSVVQHDAEASLEGHFASIQSLAQTTTVPQLLRELSQCLDSIASIEPIRMQLRQLPRGLEAEEAKRRLWRELVEVSWARSLASLWLVTLLDLLVRVQLNILGRHLYLQSHLHTSRPSWNSARTVTPRAQQLFLEYAHLAAPLAAARALGRMRQLASRLGDLPLTQTLDVPAILDHASSIHADFEAWAEERGWAALLLPGTEEVNRFFAHLGPDRLRAGPWDVEASQADEDLVRGMIDETHVILSSARFSAAVLAGMQAGARAVAACIEEEVGTAELILAKATPKVAVVCGKLLDPTSDLQQELLSNAAERPAVKHLCASVYACGPPL